MADANAALMEAETSAVRQDFMMALDGLIDSFADDPGISDDELIDALEARASAIRLNIMRLEGAEVAS
jgi:hypothetical protein